MKQTKLISLLLVICLVAALLAPGTVAMEAKAADGEENDGLVVNKTAKANDDGTYTITLEAYATGKSVTSSTEKDVPTDIILVLDQSGSMAYDMYTYTFVPYESHTNNFLYGRRYNQQNENNKNLYYLLDSGEYIAVSVEVEQYYGYTKIEEGRNNTSGWWGDYTNYWENSQNLYALINGEYQRVTVQQEWIGNWWNGYNNYSYYVGNELIGEEPYDDGEPKFSNIEGGCLYLQVIDDSKTVYTYSYTPAGGETVEFGSSVGANTTERDFVLYQRQRVASGTRRQALKTAVSNFIAQVSEKAVGPDGQPGTPDDVNHRVAVLGFASDDSNTELLSIPSQYGNSVSPVIYYRANNSDYQRVLQDMNTKEGQDTVNAAINELAASGATRADLGMDMAQNTLSNNPVKEGEQRNRVVVFFTDGSPTSRNGFELGIAEDAIQTSENIEDQLQADVYAVGIFDGADAASAGTKPYGDLDNDSRQLPAASNWFMQNVSSNRGVVQSPSYYLSAADAGTLNSIFQQISDQIQEGGSSIELGAEAVVRDEISPYFKLPDGATSADINLSLVSCTGVNQSGELTWGGYEQAVNVTPTIDGRNISVTGFDFSENWCGPRTVDEGTTYSGKKLVISFVVETEPGFLGGNNVPTNANAGIYEKPDDTEPLKIFPVPEVNVPINDITVTAGDKNVYLLGDLTKDQLTSDATVKAGENIVINLDPTVNNYGLETWQNEFVKIEASLSDSEDKPLENGFADLKNDADYQLTVTVSPEEEPKETSDGTPADEKTGSDTGNVNVFKPEITWKDTCIDAGETPVYKSDEVVEQNFVSLNWKHGETISTEEGVTMIGSEPTLSYDYTPAAAELTEETPVKVTVKIDDQDVTTDSVFVHDPCTFDNCKWETEYKGNGYHFVVHLNTFDLTIKKVVQDANLDPHQTFVFTVTGPNGFSMEVVIKGNGSITIKNLPAGVYTVTEDTGWSWRYEPSNSSQTVTADSISDGKASVEFVNTRDDDHWLDGNAYCENKFTGIPATK